MDFFKSEHIDKHFFIESKETMQLFLQVSIQSQLKCDYCAIHSNI